MQQEITKNRIFLFDEFRGILMISILLWHFSKCAGDLYSQTYEPGFLESSTLGFIYLLLNTFAMQGFCFISGYFSKDVKKSQRKAFKDTLWPYIIFTIIAVVAELITGYNVANNEPFLQPTFALWFLLCLFIWKITIPYVSKIKWALPISFMVMLFSGLLPIGKEFALERMISFYPFFLAGYYCTSEHIQKIRGLRKKPSHLIILAGLLIGANAVSFLYGPSFEWYHLASNYQAFGMAPYEDILYRFGSVILASLWIILLLAILPNKKDLLSIVGQNTMPIYVFHITFRQILRFKGVYILFALAMIVSAISLISHLYNKTEKRSYLLVELCVIGVGLLFFTMEALSGSIPIVPENKLVLYTMSYGSAIILSFALIAPFWKKLYRGITLGI